MPDSDGLLLAAQTAVYLAEGRLDRIPSAKMEAWWRKHDGDAPPVWRVLLPMLQGQTEEPLAILRGRIERYPLEKAAEAYEQMISGRARFRVVLSIGW